MDLLGEQQLKSNGHFRPFSQKSESFLPDMSQPHPNKPNPAIQRLYREANEAWGQQDYPKSISLIEQATRKEPYNPVLLLDLARAHGQRYDYPAAERCIEKAVQISKDRAQTLGEAGQICLEFDNFDMAHRLLPARQPEEGRLHRRADHAGGHLHSRQAY